MSPTALYRSYAERKRLGLCVRCPELAISGKSRCESCLAKQRDIQKARRGRCAVEGVCLSCATQPRASASDTYSYYCESCGPTMKASMDKCQAKPETKEKNRLYGLQAYRKRIEDGLCGQCGIDEPEENRRLCSDCALSRRNYQQERRLRWLNEGLCTHCGRARDRDGVICVACLEQATQKNKVVTA